MLTFFKRKMWVKSCCVWAFFCCLALALQWLSGAGQDEFAGHPDEPGHVVTALMIRDYLLQAPGSAPMTFAEQYYLHYPKVSLGHWPPLFYLLQAAWMTVFSASRLSLLLFMAAGTATLAAVITKVLARNHSMLVSLAAGIIFMILPLAREYTSMIMSDMLSALLTLAAALFFARFLETGRARFSIAFGLAAALAILNKGSGFQLVLLPPLALLLAGRMDFFKRPALWISLAVVALLAGPWYALTWRMMANGFEKPQGWLSSLQAVAFYYPSFVHIIGFGFFALAAMEILFRLLKKQHNPKTNNLHASLAALFFCAPIFHCIITNADDTRYLLPALSPAIILGIAGAGTLAEILASRLRMPRRQTFAVILIAAAAFLAPAIIKATRKPSFGYAKIVDYLLEQKSSSNVLWLVSSDATGEGAFIAQAALRAPKPGPFVMRASKSLAQSDWAGGKYKMRFPSTKELAGFLQDSPISFIVLDLSLPPSRKQPHHELLFQAIQEHPEQWNAAAAWDVVRNGVTYSNALALFESTTPKTISHGDIKADLGNMLGRSLRLNKEGNEP